MAEATEIHLIQEICKSFPDTLSTSKPESALPVVTQHLSSQYLNAVYQANVCRIYTLFGFYQGERGDPGKKGVPGLIVSIGVSPCSKF